MTRITAILTVVTLGCAVAASAQTTYKKDIPAKLAKDAKVDEATAAAMAKARMPNATIRSVELEREHGRLIYSYDMTIAGKSGVEEVNVDAVTGKVIGAEHETAADEKTEAAQGAAPKNSSQKP